MLGPWVSLRVCIAASLALACGGVPSALADAYLPSAGEHRVADESAVPDLVVDPLAAVVRRLAAISSLIVGEAPRTVFLPRQSIPVPVGGMPSPGLRVGVDDPLADPRVPPRDPYVGLSSPEIVVDHMGDFAAATDVSPSLPSVTRSPRDDGQHLEASGGQQLLARFLTRPIWDYGVEEVATLFLGVSGVVVIALVYMLPYLVGRARRVPGVDLLLVVSVVAGWTLIGWLLCLLWAIHRVDRGAVEVLPGGRRPARSIRS